jgi:hypothetical protein
MLSSKIAGHRTPRVGLVFAVWRVEAAKQANAPRLPPITRIGDCVAARGAGVRFGFLDQEEGITLWVF